MVDNPCTMRDTRSNLAMVLCGPECVLLRATVDLGVKTTASKTAFLEPAVTTFMETFPSFLEALMAAHAVRTARKDMTDTFAESDFDNIDYKLQPPWRSVIKLPSDTKCEIESVFADLDAVTEPTLRG